MAPENAADYLIHLRDTGKITMTLDTVGSQIVCQIEDMNRQQQGCGYLKQGESNEQ